MLSPSLYPEPCNYFHHHHDSDLYVPPCLSTFDPRLPIKSDFRYIFGDDDDVEEQKKRREQRLPRLYQDESKFSTKDICELVSSGLAQSVQMAVANTRFTIPYYCPDFNRPRGGSVQLLLPVSLSQRNSRWYPHVVVALDYVPPQHDGEELGHYSATSIVGLGHARFYSRVIQKLDQEWIQISANRGTSRGTVHSIYAASRPRKQQEICSYYLRGACEFGDSCSFLHVNRGGGGRGRGGGRPIPYDLSLQGRGLLKGPSSSSSSSSFRRDSPSSYSTSSTSFQYRGGGSRGGRW